MPGLWWVLGRGNQRGEVYAHLAHDLHAGTYNTPGFDHALRNARLIEAVTRAAKRGERQRVLDQIERSDEAALTIRA
jgi:hypothetical protein